MIGAAVVGQRTLLAPQLVGRQLMIPTSIVGWTTTVTIHTLNLDTQQWHSFEPDAESGGAAGYILLPDGMIATVAGMNISSSVYISKDMGKSWQKKGSSPTWLMALLANNGVLYAARLDHMGAISAADSVSSMWTSSDNGETWAKQGILPTYMQQIHPLAKPGALLFVDIIGNRSVSADAGRTWRQL